ncbi:hypothetical protein TRFO_20822 [Tritrichomonas foetus]|uniref:Uncharacterized protein n=1 Tax=Tritrichomonas foetus TaxID=1144522 RepID=A0A1J4KL36_9EUKA|nr:hypothetical protein TRFO_20822 [Tritrichomonas foetus]|eukprot:OHT10085.1 hypothetical protein TRFO_20822 [Tritrichomonas foetus]
MDDEEAILFYPISQTCWYNSNFDNCNDSNQISMNSFPMPNSADSFKNYMKEAEKWKECIDRQIQHHFLFPLPLSFSYRKPSKPHVPSAQEKIRMSNANRIAAKTFDVNHTHLYPENYLYLLNIIREGSLFTESEKFPILGPRGQEIPIISHISDETPWNGIFISPKPEPYIYQDYNSFEKAINKWFLIFQKKGKIVPHPDTMKDTLNISLNDESNSKIYIFKSQSDTLIKYQDENNNSILSMEMKNYSNITELLRTPSFKRTCLDSENVINFWESRKILFSHCLSSETNFEKLGEVVNTLELSTRLDRNKNNETQYTNFASVNDDDIDSFNILKFKHYKQLISCPEFVLFDDMKERSYFIKCIKNPLSDSIAFKYSLFIHLIKYLNDKRTTDQILFLNDIVILENCARVINLFSPSKAYLPKNYLHKLNKIMDSKEENQIVIHIYKVLIEQSYTYVLIKFLEMKMEKYKFSYLVIKKRYEATRIQMDQIIKLGVDSLIKWFNSSINHRTAPVVIELIYLITCYASSASYFFEKYGNSIVDFISSLSIVSNTNLLVLQKILFTNSKFIHLLFPVFCDRLDELQSNDFLKLTSNVIEFVILLHQYAIDKENNSQHSMRILSKIVQLLPDAERNDYYLLIFNICRFISRNKNNSADIISQSLSIVFSIIDIKPKDQYLVLILDSIRVLISSPGANNFISMCGENFKFIFDMIQKGSQIIQDHSYKLLISLLIKNRLFTSFVASGGIFEICFQNALKNPPIFAQLGFLKFFTYIKTGVLSNNPIYFSSLLEGGSQALELIVPHYSIKSHGMMMNIVLHDHVYFPQKYYISTTLNKILSTRHRRESTIPHMKKRHATMRHIPKNKRYSKPLD